jgi:hypothetical protein
MVGDMLGNSRGGDENRCTCGATVCRHGLTGCPNPAVIELTVSAKRGSQPEGSPIKNYVCETCWAILQINLPNLLGVNGSQT